MKPAKERIRQARINLAFNQVFLGTILLYLPCEEVALDHPSIGTMATDYKRIYYNPFFVDQLSDAEIEGVLCHEALHVALLHGQRREGRFPLPWNWAADFAINRDLLAGKLALPRAWIGREGKACSPCIDSNGKYGELPAEPIYDLIMKDFDPSNSLGDDMGEILEVEIDEKDLRELETDWNIRVRQAVAQASKHAGFVPGSIKLLIEELNAPQVDWREELRDFVGTAISADNTWNSPSRRLIGSGLYIPGRGSNAVDKVLFLIDRSGSISEPALVAALSEAQGMIDEGSVKTVLWATVDTEIHSTGEVAQGETFTGIELEGGGGTDFRSAMLWCREQSEIACIVFFTDGHTISWGENPGKPMLVIGAEEDRESIARNPHGRSLVIKV